MEPKINHSWNLSWQQARLLQQELATKVIKRDKLHNIQIIAGADVAYQKDSDKLIAAIVIVVVDVYSCAVRKVLASVGV